MMRSKWNRWLSGVGVVVLIGGFILANYGGGVTSAQAHEHDNHHNPFHLILAKLNEILAKLNNGASSSSSGGGAGNQTLRWDTHLPSASRFTVLADFNNAAVRDNSTGLVWEQNPLTSASDWGSARFACADKNVGGTRGWRLPSMVELTSLIDPSLPAPYVPGVFIGVQLNPYWSATSLEMNNNSNKWSVNFGDGLTGTSSKNSPNNVWCVRGPMQESEY